MTKVLDDNSDAGKIRYTCEKCAHTTVVESDKPLSSTKSCLICGGTMIANEL